MEPDEKTKIDDDFDYNPFIIRKIPKFITDEWMKEKIMQISDAVKNNSFKKLAWIDNRDKYTFLHDIDSYYDKIYNTYDISKFNPELEFCETAEQKDIWMFFRLKVSSFEYTHNKSGYRNIKILVRDKLTKKYVGITSLGSDVYNCSARDNYLSLTANNKKTSLKYIMNITTCVGIPPFSFNFNGGKLITMLMLSKEVYDYVVKKYNDPLVAVTTFSLYGKSIQYDRIKRLKYVGITKGFGSSLISETLNNAATTYLYQNNIKLKNNRSVMDKFMFLERKFKIKPSILKHGDGRGSYVALMGQNSIDFLTGKSKDFIVDKLESVDEISNFWKTRWAQQRFNSLINYDFIKDKCTNKSHLMIKSNFRNNILNKKEYSAFITKKSRDRTKKLNPKKLTDEEYIEIIKHWINNKNKPLKYFSDLFSKQFNKYVDQQMISKIIKAKI